MFMVFINHNAYVVTYKQKDYYLQTAITDIIYDSFKVKFVNCVIFFFTDKS